MTPIEIEKLLVIDKMITRKDYEAYPLRCSLAPKEIAKIKEIIVSLIKGEAKWETGA